MKLLPLLTLATIIVLGAGCHDDTTLPTGINSPRARFDGSLESPTVVQVSSVSELRNAVASAIPYTRIEIAPGTYDLGDSSITISEKIGLTIQGAGMGSTVLTLGPNAFFGLQLAHHIDTLTISNLTIRGTLPETVNTNAIGSDSTRERLVAATFSNLEIDDVAQGIAPAGNTVAPCNDVKIVNNRLTNMQDRLNSEGATSGSGYGIVNQGCTNVRIADNQIVNADRHSIYQSETYESPQIGHIEIEHNLIINNAQTASIDRDYLVALEVARSANVVLASNVIINPRHDAMSVEQVVPSISVTDVRFINNTVLGGGGMDIFAVANGEQMFWGNKYWHIGWAEATLTPSVRPPSSDPTDRPYEHGTIVQPSIWNGSHPTQALAADYPYTNNFYVVQNEVLHQTPATYNVDPNNWGYRYPPETFWPGFTSLAAGGEKAYMMANGSLSMVDPATWQQWVSPDTFPVNSAIVFDWGYVFVSSAGSTTMYRVNPGVGFGKDTFTLPSGFAGVAAFGETLYLKGTNDCFYTIDIHTLVSSALSC